MNLANLSLRNKNEHYRNNPSKNQHNILHTNMGKTNVVHEI